MKISLDWLNDYVDIEDIKAEELADRLTMKSAEVEEAHWVGAHFEQVVTARVDKVVPHPDSERLKLATVFDGKTTQTVVCGAPNVAEGQIVLFAPLGTILPGNFEIKVAKIRGVESCGMICAQDELGLGDDHDGIMVLNDDVEPGKKALELFGGKDFIIEIENKTINHRPDLWGHFGIAREVRTIFEKPWKKELKYTGIDVDSETEKFEIEITTEKCLHYLALKMENIKVGPSPKWLSTRLNNIGIRSINNIVDAANYIMLETGHPMHTFDRRDVAGNKIVIRNADENEVFVTLDEMERVLKSDDAVIADENRVLAIAGVMGGLNSEVKDDTKEIVIESALFAPTSVRRTANRLDLRTDASSRFEKALWVENCYLAMQRFVELVKELVPQAVVTSKLAVGDNSENYGFKGKIEITTDRIRSLLGIPEESLRDDKIVSVLEFLDFGIDNKNGILSVEVPDHRRSKDVSIGEDITEEIGRIYGYNNIEPVTPLFGMERAPVNVELEKTNQLRRMLAETFKAHEVMNYCFTGSGDLEKIPYDVEKLVETVDDREVPYLRYTMASLLLKDVHENLKNFRDFKLFEFGKVFSTESERARLAIISTGEGSDILEMKRIVETIARDLRIPDLRYERPSDDFLLGKVLLHPGRSAIFSSVKPKIGIFGEIHPSILKKFDINVPVSYIEIDLEELYGLPQKNVKFTPLFKFPSTDFDVTAIVPEKTEVAKLIGILKKAVDRKQFVECKVVGHFSGSPIPEGYMSISFRIVMNAKDRTLTGDEIKTNHEKTINAVRKAGFKISGDK